MKRALPFLLVLLLATPAAALTWAPRYGAADYRSKITNFVHWFHKAVRADRCRAALGLVDTVVDVALEHGINPALLAAVVTHESSWKPDALGRLGERGLMQVMNGRAATPREQLREGARILAAAYGLCGTVEGALSMYATGSSCKPWRGAGLRVRMAERIEGEF